MAKKNPAAVSLGRKGGAARWGALSPAERAKLAARLGKARWQGVSSAERSEAAKKAIAARWSKRKRP